MGGTGLRQERTVSAKKEAGASAVVGAMDTEMGLDEHKYLKGEEEELAERAAARSR
jgi:hypothetical protein